jgi:hypothetical protein
VKFFAESVPVGFDPVAEFPRILQIPAAQNPRESG